MNNAYVTSFLIPNAKYRTADVHALLYLHLIYFKEHLSKLFIYSILHFIICYLPDALTAVIIKKIHTFAPSVKINAIKIISQNIHF